MNPENNDFSLKMLIFPTTITKFIVVCNVGRWGCGMLM